MRDKLAFGLAGIGLGLAVGWLVEAGFVGRDLIAIYLGPLAPLVVFASLLVQDPASRIYWAGFVFVAIGYLVIIALEVAKHV